MPAAYNNMPESSLASKNRDDTKVGIRTRKTVGTSKLSSINSDGSLTDELSDDLIQATRKLARKDDELLEKISAP
ncbi:MAG: hypothetical protein Q9221_008793 [Calogaya cf. arnoldii]